MYAQLAMRLCVRFGSFQSKPVPLSAVFCAMTQQGGNDTAPLLNVENGQASDIEGGVVHKPSMAQIAAKVVAKFSNQDVAKFSNQNQRFKSNAFMAVVLASYMTLFGLPVYSSNVSYALFGQKDEVLNNKVVTVCGPNMMGPKVNVAEEGEPPILVNYNRTFFAGGVQPHAWCGMLPGAYFGMWPSVVQTAMFTLYGTTGATMKNAWQCLCGTFCAVANVYLLTFIYPGGAKDPHYSSVVAWLDLTGVIFLFLASRADINTRIMGMWSTVRLMLHFMNPNTGPTIGTYKTSIPYMHLDGETTMTMLTQIMGCTIAVMATLLPKPLLNITHVDDDAQEVVRAVDMILSDSIDYYCGSDITVQRHQILGKVAALQGTLGRVNFNLDASFWETFNIAKFAKIRELYGGFRACMTDTIDNMYLVKAALMQLRFDPLHADFVEALGDPLRELHREVVELLENAVKFCRDGTISSDEREQIQTRIEGVVSRQKALSANCLSSQCRSGQPGCRSGWKTSPSSRALGGDRNAATLIGTSLPSPSVRPGTSSTSSSCSHRARSNSSS